MSARTRINRPTTATPRKVGTRRFLHLSTNYGWVAVGPMSGNAMQFVKAMKGVTYRRPQP